MAVGAISRLQHQPLVEGHSHVSIHSVPKESGKRQPIHASQLAAIALKMAADIQTNPLDAPKLLEVGGDETLSYLTMLKRLQSSSSGEAVKRRCKLFTIPNQLFFFLAAPIALFSLKRYEAVLRIGADLAGLAGFVPGVD